MKSTKNISYTKKEYRMALTQRQIDLIAQIADKGCSNLVDVNGDWLMIHCDDCPLLECCGRKASKSHVVATEFLAELEMPSQCPQEKENDTPPKEEMASPKTAELNDIIKEQHSVILGLSAIIAIFAEDAPLRINGEKYHHMIRDMENNLKTITIRTEIATPDLKIVLNKRPPLGPVKWATDTPKINQ
jgi:hypothetical protein